jgi:hypothetical protein
MSDRTYEFWKMKRKLWTHFCYTKQGRVYLEYVNGTQYSPFPNWLPVVFTKLYSCIKFYYVQWQIKGYHSPITDLRISNIARYKHDFTLPTSAMRQEEQETKLLLHDI